MKDYMKKYIHCTLCQIEVTNYIVTNYKVTCSRL